MYDISLTAQQHRVHTAYFLSIWQVLPDGSKQQIVHRVDVIPEPNDGLFEMTPGEAARVVLAHFTGIAATID
jgi:hypothetical protein